MSEFLQGLNLISIVFIVCAAAGGILIGRRSRNKEINDATTQLNETLEKEIEALRRRVSDLEQDRNKQYSILDAIRYALRQYGLRVVINGEYVSLIDNTGQNKITRIRPKKQVTPTPQDDDDDSAAN